MSNPSGSRPIPDYYSSTRRASYATIVAGRNAATTDTAHSREPSGASLISLEEERDRDRGLRQTTLTPSSWDSMAGTNRYDDGRRPGASSASAAGGLGHSAYGGDAVRYDGLGCHDHDDHPPFFTPSYLRHSRHVQRLRQVYEEHVAELKALATKTPRAYQSSLSISPSSTSLHKVPPQHMHRGVMQDVIERLPPPISEEEKPQPLPSRWNEHDRWTGLELMADETEVRFNGVAKSSDEAASVRSDWPMPREAGIYYFEVTILSRAKDAQVGIGFSTTKTILSRLPGWEQESWAYHGDDGFVFGCSANGRAYGPKFNTQDVIGCGVNFRTQTAFFTKNGMHLGNAFNNIKLERLYPSVGMKKPGEHVRVNFGKTPFVFDIDGLVKHERQTILAEIDGTDVSSLHPPDNESALIHNLIGQYLAHEGYVETAKAFATDVEERQQAFSDHTPPFRISSEDDQHAINRQRIRKCILDGDIDRALKYLSVYYQKLFDDGQNRDLYFRLRCRKYVEMTRQYANLVSSPAAISKSVDSLESNGHTGTDVEQEQPSDTQMELDDQLRREASRNMEPPANDDVDMDVSQELPPKASPMKADQLLMALVAYGQELQQEFKTDRRPHIQKHLMDISASFAYGNIYESPISHLFALHGRGEIAEEVNGAILISLGKPSSAALERVCATTETLLGEAATRTGGAAAAFINVRDDFLRE